MNPMIADNNIYGDFSRPDRAINILIVDDDKFILEYLSSQIVSLGHTFEIAGNGVEALKILEVRKGEIDIVLMDRAMPEMDGLMAVRQMKYNPDLRYIPVVMLTSADKPEEIRAGLEAGVFYYLTKPVKNVILRSVLESAGRTAQQNKTLMHEFMQHRLSFQMIDSCKFHFKTLGDAENLAVFMANCFPEPGRTLPGLGELLTNAIEHGNLGIGYERKRKFSATEDWRREVQSLQRLPEHAGKFATATISRRNDGVYVVIEDQGKGFSWKKFMSIDPSRSGDFCGRGIAQARAVSFDKLTYNEEGNKAIAFVGHRKKLEW